jgi:hypothetical protein
MGKHGFGYEQTCRQERPSGSAAAVLLTKNKCYLVTNDVSSALFQFSF